MGKDGRTNHGTGSPRAELAAALARRRADIEERWTRIVTSDADERHVHTTELREAIPHYLRRLSDSLDSDGTVETEGTSAWRQIAREHAVTRVRRGFDVRQLVRELIALRAVLLEVLAEEGLMSEHLESEYATEAIEAAIAESVTSYAESRDYSERSREAQHLTFITHELRNPLTTAFLMAERLRESGTIAPREMRAFELLERSLRRVRELLVNVLSLEQIEAGTLVPHASSVPLREVLEEPILAARDAARERDVQITASYDPEARVFADPSLAVPALTTLLEDAIALTSGGHVDLTVKDDGEEVIIDLHHQSRDGEALQLPRLFDPFRGPPTQRGELRLRLVAARRAIEAQGGEIDVETTPAGDCHFWLSLPKSAPARGGERHV